MHYLSPVLEDSYSEEMIMTLQFPFTLPNGMYPPGPTRFQMTGTGLDSLGEFTIQDRFMSLRKSYVAFEKVYHRPAAKGGIRTHAYVGVLTPLGMAGIFSIKTGNMCSDIGCWFLGRPTSCVNQDASRGKEVWTELVAGIKAKVAANAKLRTKKILAAKISASHFSEHPNQEIYELPLSSEVDSLLDRFRHTLHIGQLFSTETTTIAALREGLSFLQDLPSSHPLDEPQFSPFESDTTEKAKLRLQLQTAFDMERNRLMNTIIHSQAQALPGYVATLEKYPLKV